ncbi:MAG: class II fructose-bisphosphatase [Spirochaetes bacterium]|nr:class II fructose-bisphosphatase [Spirochaetota bacterium]
MERNLALEVVRVTEAAALFASRYAGRGDSVKALNSAIDAMIKVFASVSVEGRVVIGKAEPADTQLSTNSEIGNKNGPEVDIVIDPLDGGMTCARGGQNSISAVAMGERGAFFIPPTLYMEKIAVGSDVKGVVDITEMPEINIKRVARAKRKYIEDVTVCVLDRPRHAELIERIRSVGARIILITDGDISGAVAAAMDERPIDILMGIGRSMEGVLAAAAIKCLGGDIQARLVYKDDNEIETAKKNGITDPGKIFMLSDLIPGKDLMFSATGITDGEFLKGVRFLSGGAKTDSIVMRSKTHTIRYITAMHQFDYKPMY